MAAKPGSTCRAARRAHLRALAVFGTTLAWAAGQGGTIVRSEDFGATWLPCNTPSEATLYAIGFQTADEGWAVGAGGVVLHSTDGGANWALEDFGTTATLRGLSFFAHDPGWVVGDCIDRAAHGHGAAPRSRCRPSTFRSSRAAAT